MWNRSLRSAILERNSLFRIRMKPCAPPATTKGTDMTEHTTTGWDVLD
ncbi:MAG: hypothetical protein QOH52_2698, partial [Pseudonocardiales bacterium]|nr:hypothetical protein [Pseudonocardiales bacterium]